MSEISEKNASLELERCIRFWELKPEIYRLLTLYYCTDELDVENDRKAKKLIEEIESISAI